MASFGPCYPVEPSMLSLPHMFDDWKRAWQQAVENFQREIADDDSVSGLAQVGAMRRDLTAARNALEQLGFELARAREECAEEEKQEANSRRRGELAASIGDDTTVKLARQWAERHQQRAQLLRQKAEILARELAMRNEDLQRMQNQFNEVQSQLGTSASSTPSATMPPKRERDKLDRDFNRLERERAAQTRLDELKKKMK
jgi:hypothetical protein